MPIFPSPADVGRASDSISSRDEQASLIEAIDNMADLSDEGLAWLVAGVQQAIRNRNAGDVGDEDFGRPWSALRRHLVPDAFDRPARLTLRWRSWPEGGQRGWIRALGHGVERPVAEISLATTLGRAQRRAALVHELVHWTRGVQSPAEAPGGSWERTEEERVVRAIAHDVLERSS